MFHLSFLSTRVTHARQLHIHHLHQNVLHSSQSHLRALKGVAWISSRAVQLNSDMKNCLLQGVFTISIYRASLPGLLLWKISFLLSSRKLWTCEGNVWNCKSDQKKSLLPIEVKIGLNQQTGGRGVKSNEDQGCTLSCHCNGHETKLIVEPLLNIGWKGKGARSRARWQCLKTRK